MPSTTLTPISSLHVLRHQIPAHRHTPNTSLQNKPLLIYKNAFPSPSLTASTIESHLSHIDVVTPQWRYTMYNKSHFHSISHEVLVVSNGKAKLCFGHEDNPAKVEEVVGKGDVIIIPAGVAHRLWEDIGAEDEGPFEMVGSYPKGCGWDMCYGVKGREGNIEKIKGLGWFERDPIYGDVGPVLDV